MIVILKKSNKNFKTHQITHEYKMKMDKAIAEKSGMFHICICLYVDEQGQQKIKGQKMRNYNNKALIGIMVKIKAL